MAEYVTPVLAHCKAMAEKVTPATVSRAAPSTPACPST
jgi:hypothetical protein